MQPESLVDKLKRFKVLIFIVIGLMLVLFIAVPLTLSALEDRTPGRVAAFASHVEGLNKLAGKQKRYISNSDLENQNTNLSVILSGVLSDTKTFQATYKAGKADESRVAANAASLQEIEAGLTQSRLSNTYEKTYRSLMTFELEALRSEATVLASKTGSKGKPVFERAASQIKTSIDSFKALDKDQ